MKSTPLLLEAPKGHETYEMGMSYSSISGRRILGDIDIHIAVEKKFQKAWHNVTGPLPTIKKVFKVIENDEFLKPYAIYK